MNWDAGIQLIRILAWPLVVIIGLIMLRKPLTAFLSSLGGRVTKLGVFQVSIELATLPPPPSPWSDPNFPQSSEMTGGDVFSTALMTLFERIQESSTWEYLIVDIKDGRRWLLSRVFIFTVFLKAMRGLKCVVFVETTDSHYRKLIGVASPDAVRLTLLREFPWFESALSESQRNYNIPLLHPSVSPGDAGNIIRHFIEQPEMRANALPAVPEQWTRLGVQEIWEHTEWLTTENKDRYLRRSFYEWDSSIYLDTPAAQPEARTKELLSRKAPHVALVNSRFEFQGVVDRATLVESAVEASLRA
jgi:hypothetical protein